MRDYRLTCTRLILVHYLVDSEHVLRLFRKLITLRASVFLSRVPLSCHTELRGNYKKCHAVTVLLFNAILITMVRQLRQGSDIAMMVNLNVSFLLF